MSLSLMLRPFFFGTVLFSICGLSGDLATLLFMSGSLDEKRSLIGCTLRITNVTPETSFPYIHDLVTQAGRVLYWDEHCHPPHVYVTLQNTAEADLLMQKFRAHSVLTADYAYTGS